MNPTAAAVLGAMVATVVVALKYAVTCWLKPYKRCGACDGSGYGPSITKACWWCDGATMRLRLGRRVFNYIYDQFRSSVRGRS